MQDIVTAEELEIPDAPGVVFTFWKNPSKMVVSSLFDVIMATAEELAGTPSYKMDALEERYYAAVCELVIDCNLESLDFSTPQAAMASFDAPDIPIGFVHQVVTSYLSRLLKFNESVKKALALYLLGSVSGRGSATKKDEK